jgi:cobalt-zinc-cadmium efflux system outer membrane protein
MMSPFRSMIQQWWPRPTSGSVHDVPRRCDQRLGKTVSTLLCMVLPATVLPGCLTVAPRLLFPRKLIPAFYDEVHSDTPKLNTQSTQTDESTQPSESTPAKGSSSAIKPTGFKSAALKGGLGSKSKHESARAQSESSNAFEPEAGTNAEAETNAVAESVAVDALPDGAGGAAAAGPGGSDPSATPPAASGTGDAAGKVNLDAGNFFPQSTSQDAGGTPPAGSGAKPAIENVPGSKVGSKLGSQAPKSAPISTPKSLPAEGEPATPMPKATPDADSMPATGTRGGGGGKSKAAGDQDIPAAVSVPAIPQTGSASVGTPLQQVTLQQAIIECENSATLHAAAERTNQANADYTTASLLPNPTISGIASLQPFPGRPFTVIKTGGPPQYDLWTSYPLDWYLYGKRNAAMNAAAAGTQVASSEFQDYVRQRIIVTRLAFYDVLEARELRELTKQDIANLRQVEEITIKQIDLGGAGTVELDRVRLALFNSEREAGVRETANKNAKSTLRMLMGRTEADPDFDVVGSLEITRPIEPVSTEVILKAAQSVRPDIEAARKQVEWANAILLQEETKAKPQVSGTLGFTYQQQGKALGVPDAASYGGGVVLTLPTFDKNQGNINKAQSAYSQAYYNLQARLTSLQSEVEQAATAFRAAHQAVTSINIGQATAAKNVRDKIAAAYAAGGRPLIEVLDTERAYRDTYRLLISGRANYWKSLNQLNAVAGTTIIDP